MRTFVNVCGNGEGEITYDAFVRLLWQVTCGCMMNAQQQQQQQQ